jgi:hypothetical protein
MSNGYLKAASRRILKCTYVPLKLPDVSMQIGRALAKFGFVGRLGLQRGEVNAAVSALKQSKKPFPRGVLGLLRSFEDSPIPSQLPSPSAFASVPAETLESFGDALVSVRKLALDDALDFRQRSGRSRQSAFAVNQVHAASIALNTFKANIEATPIGMLNLERIVMTPVGVQRGELLATIPLAPLEQTAVVHKEWSVTSKEFTSIVTDSLENYSETGVTENTELAESTTAQNSHSNQFNINATVSGGYGPVTTTISSGFSAQDQHSESATASRKHAIATTRKASARVKQEHKVTISTTTVTGTSETSTRVLQNPSSSAAMRVDYFNIMRKWHVGLYRYGLRLTYDIAIPEPAATIRRTYARIDELKKQIKPFTFGVDFTAITRENWPEYAAQYEATVPEPPTDPFEQSFISSYSVAGDTTYKGPVTELQLDIADGYEVTEANMYTDQTTGGSEQNLFADIDVNRTVPTDTSTDASGNRITKLKYLVGLTGRQYVVYAPSGSTNGVIEVDVQLKLTNDAFVAWRQKAWNALFNAAQTKFYAQQQDIQAQIAELEDKVNNVDTLTLRREEGEEIMKGVLRWLLGPTFDFMPDDVSVFFAFDPATDIVHGAASDSGDGLAPMVSSWSPMFMYQEMVKFINQAIEWENVLYFLYSYFWDIAPSWDFIRQLKHPDATRQAFLRAGSARVVLTVRKGWEEAWVNFVEAGGFGKMLLPNHPYMSIAKEIESYDQKNYPGIPPANPAGGPLPDSGESVATVSSDTIDPSGDPVTLLVNSSEGFVPGYTAIIDSYDSKAADGETLQETQRIVAVPDGTHITVERIENAHDGSTIPFAVMQAGEKGQLIAEWFEYTPTSGTDISLSTDLGSIA